MTQNPTAVTGAADLFSTDIFQNQPIPVQAQTEEISLLTPTEKDIYESLSPNEKKALANVVSGMDLTQPNFRSEYCAGIRKEIADVNAETLRTTRTRDLGDVSKSMSGLMLQLKEIDITEKPRGLFGRAKSYIAQLNAQLAPIETNIGKAVQIMDDHKAQLATDNANFDQLYLKNLGQYRSLSMHIIAGKMKLDEERKTTLMAMHQKAVASGDLADSEAYQAYKTQLDQFDTLLSELEASKTLCLQTAPAIRMAKQNNELLIQKFDYIVTTAVPAWRTQIQLALNLENSKQAAQAAQAAIGFTNELIRKNADMLYQGTTETAKLSQQEIIESSTLEYANQKLIQSMQDVFTIYAEGEQMRTASREKRTMLEEDLKKELLQLATR